MSAASCSVWHSRLCFRNSRYLDATRAAPGGDDLRQSVLFALHILQRIAGRQRAKVLVLLKLLQVIEFIAFDGCAVILECHDVLKAPGGAAIGAVALGLL